MNSETRTFPARHATAVVWLHRIAGVTGFVIVLSFLSATIAVELFGDADAIRAVKRAIASALLLLVPALAAAGGSGRYMTSRRRGRLVLGKLRRMRWVALNGVLVLAPSALVLWRLAESGDFGWRFAVVQAIELAAGAVNATLLGLMIRDGLRLSGRLRQTSNARA